MADREIQLPRAGDVWIPRRERVYMRRGVDGPIVDVVHLPDRILHERRLSWFLQNYQFQRAGDAGEG